MTTGLIGLHIAPSPIKIFGSATETGSTSSVFHKNKRLYVTYACGVSDKISSKIVIVAMLEVYTTSVLG